MLGCYTCYKIKMDCRPIVSEEIKKIIIIIK